MEHYAYVLIIVCIVRSYAQTVLNAENYLSPFQSVLSVGNISVDWSDEMMFNQIKAIAQYACSNGLIFNATGKGEIKSPDYDAGSYAKELNCSYKIQAPYGYRIKITFKDMGIKPTNNCIKDKLKLRVPGASSYLGVFCGYMIPRPVITREGENEIEMSFQTKTSSERGFHIEYEASPDVELCGENEIKCRNRNCYRIAQKCDGSDDCGDGTDEENCGLTINKPSNENCGNTPIRPKNLYVDSNRFVAATPNSWPWQVSLQYAEIEPNGHFCGGTLISPQWVISAAYCFTGIKHPSDVRIVLGSHLKFNKTEYEVTRWAERIISYPDLEFHLLKDADQYNDISLVKLNAPVTFTDGVQPVCLWWWRVEPGWKCFSTGWGPETRLSVYPKQLKQSIQFIRNREQCRHEVDTEICVEKPHDDPCVSDVGGPLVCYLSDHWQLIGTASHNAADYRFKMGKFCQENENKFIFTSIANKRDWIERIIDENS